MISGVVFSALNGLVSGRCYPSRFPQEAIAGPGDEVPTLNQPTWPAIRYTIIDSTDEGTICGTGPVDTDRTSVQVDIVAKTYGAMTSLRDQVIAALASTDPPCLREAGGFETWDVPTATHRCVLTYSFHASTAAGSP